MSTDLPLLAILVRIYWRTALNALQTALNACNAKLAITQTTLDAPNVEIRSLIVSIAVLMDQLASNVQTKPFWITACVFTVITKLRTVRHAIQVLLTAKPVMKAIIYT